MIDVHIHLEKGEYTPEWVGKFVRTAVDRGLDEICLLEHSYRFREFVPMYEEVRSHSEYIDSWLNRKAGVHDLSEYLRLVEKARAAEFPVKIRFGLEVCYFQHSEDLVYAVAKDSGLDFLVGSVHFVGDFAFDHRPEFWEGVDVDSTYRQYFESSCSLAKSGLYNGIAHPDSIKLYGHKPSFSLLPYYRKLAEELAKQQMYAEQNSGVYRRSGAELGLNADFIKALKQYGVKILTASDAHRPEDVGAYIPELQQLMDA